MLAVCTYCTLPGFTFSPAGMSNRASAKQPAGHGIWNRFLPAQNSKITA